MQIIDRFRSGENLLTFVCDKPDQAKKTGVLFIHAGEGNRLGPHRMFVEMARELYQHGFSTCRFDFTGCGDSTGIAVTDGTRGEVLDTIAAARHFCEIADLDKIIIFAISRGSRIAFDTAAYNTLPLTGMILLSPPVANGRAAAKKVANYSKEYLRKLKDPNTILRMLRGRISFRGVWRTLTNAWQIKHRYSKNTSATYASVCPVYLIYGECDPIRAESRKYYLNECHRHGMPVVCNTIANANHSFFHYQWKEQIIKMSRYWVNNLDNGKAS